MKKFSCWYLCWRGFVIRAYAKELNIAQVTDLRQRGDERSIGKTNVYGDLKDLSF